MFNMTPTLTLLAAREVGENNIEPCLKRKMKVYTKKHLYTNDEIKQYT